MNQPHCVKLVGVACLALVLAAASRPLLARAEPAPSRALLQACAVGNLEEVRRLTSGQPGLLELNATLDAQISNLKLESPLDVAAYFGRADVVGLLLDGGAPANPAVDSDSSPLFLAISGRCDVPTIRVLLDRGANMEAEGPAGMTPVGFAASCGRIHAVEELVRRGANVRHIADHGIDDLFTIAIAAGNGRPTLEALLEIVPLPAPDDLHVMGPAFACVPSNNVVAFRWLKERGYDIARELDDSAVLLVCVREGQVATLAELLSVRANYRTATASGQTVHQLANGIRDEKTRAAVQCLLRANFGN